MFARMESGGGGRRLVIQGVMESETPWWMEDGRVCAPDWFRTQLESAEGQPLTVVLDSPGGDVSCGLAIYQMLRERKGATRCEVIRAYSAATLVMAGCDRGARFMSPAGLMLIHNPSTYASGDWREMDKTLRYLQAVKRAVLAAYTEATGKPEDDLAELMDQETCYSAEEAVAAGWADGLLPAASGQTVSLHEARQVLMQAEEQAARCRQTGAAGGENPLEHKERAEAARWAQALLAERMR